MRRAAAAVLFTLSLLPSIASAQQKLVETIEVRVTNVDVVVTDKKGNPIVGLNKDDFEIFENGKPQPVTNFYEVRPESVNTSNVPTDDSTLAPAEMRQRRIIFFIDNASLHPLKRNEVFGSIDKFFDKLFQPGDQAMVVTWNRGLRMVCGFTDDPARLRTALGKVARMSGGGVQMNVDKERLKREVEAMIAQVQSMGRRSAVGAMDDAYQQSLSMTRAYADDLFFNEKKLSEAMSTMITTLAGLEGKKVMVFVGSQLPDKPGMDMFQWVDQTFVGKVQATPVAFREAGRFSLATELEKVARQANANNVTMYMIDGADPTKGSAAEAGSQDVLDPTVDFMDFTNTANMFNSMAKMTGGIALMRTNNFDLALNTVARDLGAYYSLGYRPADDKPGDRKIVVKTKNPEFRVRSRTTYVAKSAEETTADRVVSNAFHSQVKGEIPITLTTGQAVAFDKKRWKVPVRISFPSNITLLPDGDNLVGGFTVYFAVIDENGSMSAVTKKSQPVKLPRTAEPALRSKPIAFTAEIMVAAGEHYLSVGIVDDVASSAGYARTRVAARLP
ncbi:MAG TPA: VWA domain-containing protein [Thermoanaerobaculia bacterium]|nr:VWA domain-containing protein [Thermoanaerobaculia bacterium]